MNPDPHTLPLDVQVRERVFQAAKRAPRGPRGEVGWSDPDRLFHRRSGIGQFNPSLLVSRKSMYIFDKMRNDDQIFASMTLKKLAAIGSGWTLVSPEGKDTKVTNPDTGEPDTEVWEPTRFIQWCLDSFLEESFEQGLMEVLAGFEYGHSVVEKVLSEVALGEWAGKVGLKALKGRKPHHFDFEVDGFGNLLAVKQQTPEGVQYYPPEKFVLYSHMKEWGNWYGASDLEVAYRPWWLKDNLYRWMAIDSERYAIPMVVITYNENGVAPTFNSEIQGILESLSAGSSMTLPRGEDASDIHIEVIDAKKSGAGRSDTLVNRITACNQDIARALLMPGLLGITADMQQGSFARAQTHFDVFMLIMDHLRTTLSRQIIDKQIIEYLFDINYGVPEDGLYPYFEFDPMTEEQVEAIAGVWEKLTKVNAVEPQRSDEEHFRRMLNMPEIEKGREERKPEGDDPTSGSRESPASGSSDPDAEPGPSPIDDEDDPSKDDEEGGEKFSSFATMHEAAKGINFAAIGRKLDAMEGSALDGMRDAIATSEERVIRGVRRQMDAKGGLTQRYIDGVTFAGGKREFEAHVRNMVTLAFDAGRDDFRRKLVQAGAKESAFRVRPNFVPTHAAEALTKKAVRTTATVYDRLLKEVKRVLVMGLEQGLTTQRTVAELQRVFEPYKGNRSVLQDGKLLPAWRLEAIVRTESTAAYNQGRLLAGRDPELAPFMLGYLFTAVMDDRTTDVCTFLDGKVIKMEDGSLDELKPPRHVNCRSLLIEVTKSFPVEKKDFLTGEDAAKGRKLSGAGFSPQE